MDVIFCLSFTNDNGNVRKPLQTETERTFLIFKNWNQNKCFLCSPSGIKTVKNIKVPTPHSNPNTYDNNMSKPYRPLNYRIQYLYPTIYMYLCIYLYKFTRFCFIHYVLVSYTDKKKVIRRSTRT